MYYGRKNIIIHKKNFKLTKNNTLNNVFFNRIFPYTEKNSLYTCTRNQLFCLVRTGANFAILVEMTKYKFSKKNKESKLIWRTDPFRRMY